MGLAWQGQPARRIWQRDQVAVVAVAAYNTYTRKWALIEWTKENSRMNKRSGMKTHRMARRRKTVLVKLEKKKRR